MTSGKNVRASGLFILILGLLSMLAPLAIDMYLPSFLDIARDLNVSHEKVQGTLASFTFGFAIGQLFWGPIADSFGRKPQILIGLVGWAIASFLLICVENIENFYVLRIIQGLFGASSAVVSGALVRDLFDRNQFARIMSTITIITMIAPLLAPIIGGYIAKWFHWHVIFYVLMAVGIICFILVLLNVPETLAIESRVPLNFSNIVSNFGKLLSHKATLGYVLVSGLSFAGMFSFLTSGSLVYIQLYGVSPEHFGYFFLMNIVVLMVMTSINRHYVIKIGSEKMLQIALILQGISGVFLIFVGIFHLGLWPMAIGVAFFIGMISTIGSNAAAAMLDRYPKMAGTANGIAGTSRFGIASLVGIGLSYIPLTTERPMLFTMAGCVILCLVIYYFCCYRQTESEI